MLLGLLVVGTGTGTVRRTGDWWTEWIAPIGVVVGWCWRRFFNGGRRRRTSIGWCGAERRLCFWGEDLLVQIQQHFIGNDQLVLDHFAFLHFVQDHFLVGMQFRWAVRLRLGRCRSWPRWLLLVVQSGTGRRDDRFGATSIRWTLMSRSRGGGGIEALCVVQSLQVGGYQMGGRWRRKTLATGRDGGHLAGAT